MYNKLTGIQVTACENDIKYYFNHLDLKNDGIIDLEEFTKALENNENLFN